MGLPERYSVIEGSLHPLRIDFLEKQLPDELAGEQRLEVKRIRDKRKLMSLVEYAS